METSYKYNNIDLVVVKTKAHYTVCATQYYYKTVCGKRICASERTWRWKTYCEELIRKMDQKRTKVFTGQLIQLAKQYGIAQTIRYHGNRK